jgi:predicted Zn-dependent protease
VFLHTGLLTRLDTVDQLRAVIAHEVGHITGGHLARRDQALKGARGVAVIGMLGAAAAAVAGSPQVGVAIATGTGTAAQRSALAHSRAEEASADQAGISYLAAAGGDPGAMLEVLRLFRGQDALSARRMDPYVQSHPLWGERIALLEARIAGMPEGSEPAAEDVYWHGRMVAKIDGFLNRPGETLRRYPAGTEAATLARAVAYHRQPDPARAAAETDALIAARPDDPFYHELKGQFLLEAGQAEAAVAAYREAVELAPREPLILGGLGRALLNTGDDADTEAARDALARSVELDRADAGVLRDLALAEARLGNDGAAALATAERFALAGDFADADRNAARASALLPTGSPGWRRAQDVLSLARRATN